MALRLAPIDGAGLDGNTPNLLRVEINMMVNLQGRSNGEGEAGNRFSLSPCRHRPL